MSETTTDRTADAVPPARLATEARVWFRIGCLSFGGPAGQIALMQRLLVEELRWISSSRFLAGLDLCMLLPGPEAQQLATYVGWTRHGWRGGLVAGGLFVLPGAALMLLLSAVYALWGTQPVVAALFGGVQCAVVAIVIEALIRIGRRALASPGAVAIALAAFAALALVRAPFWLVIVLAAGAGLLLGDDARRTTPTAAHPLAIPEARGGSALPALLTAVAWIAPLAALVTLLGREALLSRIALRFTELALFSFGGAYALLSALAQRAVADGWLAAAQMADGLALAETTPGPLILVLQFVAFVAAHGAAGAASTGAALVAGAAASAVALWALFLPSFVWIFAAAPRLERVERSPLVRRVLRGVSAAVVGVILHLTLWFALHVLFERVERVRRGRFEASLPILESLDPAALAIGAVAALLLFVARQPVGRVLAVSALLGLGRLLL